MPATKAVSYGTLKFIKIPVKQLNSYNESGWLAISLRNNVLESREDICVSNMVITSMHIYEKVRTWFVSVENSVGRKLRPTEFFQPVTTCYRLVFVFPEIALVQIDRVRYNRVVIFGGNTVKGLTRS